MTLDAVQDQPIQDVAYGVVGRGSADHESKPAVPIVSSSMGMLETWDDDGKDLALDGSIPTPMAHTSRYKSFNVLKGAERAVQRRIEFLGLIWRSCILTIREVLTDLKERLAGW